MSENLFQKIYEFNLRIQPLQKLNEINSILEKGYEITDIIPILQVAGGGIFASTHGVYVHKVLFVMNPSSKKYILNFKTIPNGRDYLQDLNNSLEEQNKDGFNVLKILPLNGFLDPEAHSGVGKGTYGFALFFIKEV